MDYQTARMTLYRDLDIMDIDAQGVWTNERDGTPAPGGSHQSLDLSPFPMGRDSPPLSA